MILKKVNILFFCLMVVVLSAFKYETGNGLERTTIKVISYNIWNGFDWGKDVNRKKAFISWVNKQKPDVLALQELCGYTHEKLLEEAKAWGHGYAEILKTDGYPVGITSSKPIEIKEKILENMHHGALHCKTAGIDFFVVHFSPFSYKKRLEEAKIILNRLSKLSSEESRYMILGDFNAVSPLDADLYKDKPTVVASMQESEKQHEHVRNLFNDQLEYGVLSTFLSFPLMDVTQKYTQGWDDRISFPTQVFEVEKGKGRSENSIRIDYILVSPILAKKCINATVANKEDTFYLSDHYPVVAEFSK
ncbi:endonuclease/exonuclease/phosphatase family protein [Aestuariivivens insulae]|uniref:endonuclease/exonuclease/phosphatase family protein n=1 Tax=Aestuariivivens insulae TaxID=1621988 RepID=UPI001F55EB20|nr:endonuclease/exonuclease/phosphatase family protein [Aestuariivivens insulae]